jgi:hypothetical protein
MEHPVVFDLARIGDLSQMAALEGALWAFLATIAMWVAGGLSILGGLHFLECRLSPRRTTVSGLPLKENREALLGEMVVVGQDLGHSPLSHGVHRNAVSQAIALIQPLLIQIQAGPEAGFRLRGDEDREIDRKPVDPLADLAPSPRTGARHKVEEFRQYLLGGEETDLPQPFRDGDGLRPPLIARDQEGHPVDRIGEDGSQGVFRGAP